MIFSRKLTAFIFIPTGILLSAMSCHERDSLQYALVRPDEVKTDAIIVGPKAEKTAVVKVVSDWLASSGQDPREVNNDRAKLGLFQVGEQSEQQVLPTEVREPDQSSLKCFAYKEKKGFSGALGLTHDFCVESAFNRDLVIVSAYFGNPNDEGMRAFDVLKKSLISRFGATRVRYGNIERMTVKAKFQKNSDGSMTALPQ